MIKKTIRFQVGMTSCVGVNTTRPYPLTFGNYCSIGHCSTGNDYYCCNMWAENIDEFKRLHPEIVEIDVVIFGHICYIIDERIPLEWRSSFCLTGSGGLKVEDMKELLAYAKQPVEDKICGCETKDMRPSIIYSYSSNSRMREHTCSYCNRKWATRNPYYRESKPDNKLIEEVECNETAGYVGYNIKGMDKIKI